ncbi:MAG TPA: peptidoglycan glycosyltransferase [Exiguobacterium sp.]|uniref:penicillin-binding protein n=1 Tax=Exiguobacterium sp. TaxID=44751 RepID=UPI000EB89B55|nr:penicillin-binding protein [Exiguobacterium sp.]HCN56860.1 peptidoglycan glycosyltransferase [Exiguobacterium sp.]
MNPLSKSRRRVAFVMLIFAALFLVFISRFLYLSTTKKFHGEDMLVYAEKKRWESQSTLSAERGEIFDRLGSPIAINIPSYHLVAIYRLGGVKDPDETVVDFKKTATGLAPILGMSVKELETYLIENKDRSQIEFGKKGNDLTVDQKEQIDRLKLPGIRLIEEPKRYYPNGIFLSDTLGFVQKITEDNGRVVLKGQMGIEKQYDEALRESFGSRVFEKDRSGGELVQGTSKISNEPKDGSNLYLTIDHRIQQALEKQMQKMYNEYKPKNATGIVMDAKTGEILAMTDRPSFNPNLRDMTDFTNFAVSSRFEPGSTMKIFTLAAAIDAGVFRPNEPYKSGSYNYKGTVIKDYNDVGWGTIPMIEGVYHSSNVMFSILTAEKLGIERYKDYFKKFHFDQKTGIDISGEVNSQSDLSKPLNTLITSWGQSTAVTPMQILQGATAIAGNGEMVKPHIIQKADHTDKAPYKAKTEVVGKPISAEAAKATREALDGVVNSKIGTGQMYKLKDYRVIGKTGTAQISENGKYIQGQFIHSFIGMAPKDDPELIMYIAVDRPSKNESSVSGPSIMSPVFKSVMNTALQYRSIKPATQKESVDVKAKIIPSYIGKSMNQAEEMAKEQGAVPVVLGDGVEVVSQIPTRGQEFVSGERVLFKTGQTFKMPDITGWSQRDVKKLVSLYDLKLDVIGKGFVTKQSARTGTLVKENGKLTVELAEPKE